ncbi:dephospho-CoA kinase [Flavobacterium cyanobacteriorum]|uniref:Dephospho-CoA kinase n=1 Tax=Flavobacterium cyanobacteriorum TaxID=2022802 RepID=A0A255Z8U9_9FLAO|nr:dephospho-CoA kinase [Flavobacterium cyanobacteriorum]OYQ37315.1 dephospho-CoA kinase [Flavobacterium cyanobacteriorum]
MKTSIIGLTGGIGSGKSTVAALFGSLGVPVYIADDEAKKILNLPETAQELATEFGDGVFTEGLPDRKKLAKIVFTDPEKLARLNNIIHPKVSAHFKEWVRQNKAKFVIKEAAILFETGSYRDCDMIILVTSPDDLKVARVRARDHVTEAEVHRRMANQWIDEKKIPLSDYIINNVELKDTLRQVKDIYEKLQKM